MATNKTVMVRQRVSAGREEALVVTAVILPGMLLARTSADKFRPHYTAGGNAQRLFAVEDELQGKEIGETYAVDARCQAEIASRGDLVNAMLATSQTIVIGDLLESAGNGYLRKVLPDSAFSEVQTESIVGIAREAVTTTGSAARLLIEVM